jgi:hypothetical protein
MTKEMKSSDDGIFYSHDSRTFCKVSTRGYMRLKMNNGVAKFHYVGDGIETFNHNWNIEQKNKETAVLMAIQLEKPGTISVLDSGGTILSGPSPATTLSTPTVYKELSLEELKIMRDGLTEMIQMIEKN